MREGELNPQELDALGIMDPKLRDIRTWYQKLAEDAVNGATTVGRRTSEAFKDASRIAAIEAAKATVALGITTTAATLLIPQPARGDEIVCNSDLGLIKFDIDKEGCGKTYTWQQAMMEGYGVVGGGVRSHKNTIFVNGSKPPDPSMVVTVDNNLDGPLDDIENLDQVGNLTKSDPPTGTHAYQGQVTFSAPEDSTSPERGVLTYNGVTKTDSNNGKIYIKNTTPDNKIKILIIPEDTVQNSVPGEDLTNSATEFPVTDYDDPTLNNMGLTVDPNTNELLVAEQTGYTAFQLDENGIPIEETSIYMDLGYSDGVFDMDTTDNGDRIFFGTHKGEDIPIFTIEREGILYDFMGGGDWPDTGATRIEPLSNGRFLVNFFNESTPRIITLSPSGEIQVEIAQIDAPGITPDTPIKSCAVIDPAFASCTQVDPCEEMDCTPEDQCQVGMCIDGECLFEPMLDGTDCNDNQNCTTPDVCQEGVCTSTEITCDDLNPCTTDFCVEATGECAFDATPMNEEPCDDNDPETTGDQCQAGTCVGELPPVEEKPEQDDPDVVEEPYIEYVEPYEIIEQDDVFEIDSYDITPEPDEEIIEPDPDALDAEEAIEEVENPEPNPEQDSDLTPEAAAELVEELTEEDLLEEETSIPGIDQTPEQAIDQDHPSPGGCQCSIGAESTNQPQDVEDTAAQVGLLALMAAGLASLRRKSQKLFTRNRKTPETA